MKKLLNKRGSVLFLVVVVMAVLLVAASATFYVVRNQHASANTHYNSEQSYQTAFSVSETLQRYFAEELKKISSSPSAYNASIFKQMMEMGTGEANALTTHNDFSDYGLGDFDIKIVKDPSSSADDATFLITTTAETNGETTSFTQVWRIQLSAANTKYFTRFLTSTGVGTGEDTYLHVKQIFGDTYFENEFTTIKDATINKSLYSAGTLIDQGIDYKDFTDKEVAVAGNYYIIGNDSRSMNIGQVFVGGDMEYSRNTSQHMYSDAIYVMGDLNINIPGDGSINDATIFVQGDCHIKGKFSGNNTTIYVGNNLYLEGNNTWKAGANFHVKNNIYFLSSAGGESISTTYYGGELYNSGGNVISASEVNSNGRENLHKYGSAGYEDLAYNDGAAMEAVNSELDSWTKVSIYISNQTAVGTYQTWDALSFFETGGKYANAPTFDINTEITNSSGTTSNAMSDIATGAASAKGSVIQRPSNNGNILVTIKESCRLRECTGGADRLSYIIDASNEDIYVYLDDQGRGTFRFGPEVGDAVNVFIKGSHPVIFVLPEGVQFVAGKNQFIGHYELAKKISGDGQFDQLTWLADGKNLVSGKLQDEGSYNSTLGDVFATETDEDGTEYKYLNSAKFNNEKVHNNIFLVSRDKNTFDFNAVNMLAGYIYAPRTTLDINADGGYMQFFGGLIVGGYNYNHQSALLAFCSPYDPYNKDDSGNIIGASVVSNLIAEAGGGVIGGNPTPSGGATNVVLSFVGYR